MKKVPFWRVLPPLFLVWFYRLGLDTWFYQDDFGWLNVRRGIRGWADVLPAIFAPKAHGNMRPLSETGFFTLFSAVFGVEALPFRIAVFATQAAALVLLGAVVRRLTGSRAAAFWAQIFWVVNCGLAPVLCWTSIFNQALCGFFLLLAFWCLLRYVETGERRWMVAQWAAFLAGFGALETNVVYPALASAYTWFFCRKYFRRTLPLWGASAAFAAVHFIFAPPPAGGVYALHPGLSMANTFWTYWTMALGPERLAAVRAVPVWMAGSATALLTAGALLAAWRVRGAWLGLAWFALTLAPFLPLRDHVMDYYLAVPAAGLAMLGGWGVARAWAAGWGARAAAGACAALYLGFSLPASDAIVRWHHARSRAVENLVLGVEEIHRAQPDSAILLAGVSTDLFLAGLVDVPFRVLEVPRVYLAPGAEGAIRAAPELVGKFVLPEALARRELEAGRAVVYDAAGPVLRNVTGRYRAAAAQWDPAPPRFINLGDPLFAAYLGTGWGEAHDGYRVPRGRASLRIGAPRHAGEGLWVGVFAPATVPLRVWAGAGELRRDAVAPYPDRTDFRFALPAAAEGKAELDLAFDEGAGARIGFAEVR